MPDRSASVRCVLVVEQLETREVLTPVITPPNSGATVQTNEGTPYTFSGSAAFIASDTADTGQNYQADLTATNGVISVDATAAAGLGLTVTNDGTTDVTIVGTLANIDSLLSTSGVTFQPDAYYSGDAAVTLTVTDLFSRPVQSGTGTAPIHVLPVADNAVLTGQGPAFLDVPSSAAAVPPGFLTVSPWPNTSGSETVTVSFSVNVEDPTGFTLSAGGVLLTPVEGVWQISATSLAALTPLLNSLVLTPPAGFNGYADLEAGGYIDNTATYSDGTTASNSQPIGVATVPFRFFVGGSVTAPPALGTEGGTIDLGGRYVVSDPDEIEGDFHTLTLSVPSGTLTFDAGDLPPYLTATSSVGPDGSTTIVLTGDVADINQFLATPGCLTYSAGSPYFAGAVPLTLTLENHPFEPFSDNPPYQDGGPLSPPAPGAFTGVAVLGFAPVADAAFPSALNVETNQDTPVPLTIDVTALPPDPTESVLVVLTGVPPGATLNNGTDLGGGQWALSPADLSGLVLTPPPGQSGVFTLVVQAVVTDAAPGLGLVATQSESTAFTVTVTPAPSPAPPAPMQLSAPVTAAVVQVLSADPTGASGPLASTGSDPNTGPEPGNPDLHPVVVTFAAYSAGANSTASPTASAEARVSSAQSTPGSLFSQVEVPLPTYASGGERHPLPPVLPLDQTLPVAGFSDSGGDSFALIDKLYRDAATERLTAPRVGTAPVAPAGRPVAPAPEERSAAGAERSGPAPAGVATSGPQNDDTDPPAPVLAAVAVPPAGAGPAAAAFALAALVATCGWRVRGPVGAAAVRAVRWVARAGQRRFIERTV
ncbi:hypothetical protein [Frigoriglobus tundricola]|uniref:hypothetical protein n=1 Tax=Frigoriglobus tundricola TaxID=2774151 RepID=UPI00148EB200|nr:hypothetical protein [Frigoriglobus tundricola]